MHNLTSNLSKVILLSVFIAVFSFYNYHLNGREWSNGILPLSPSFYINQFATLALLASSIFFIFRKNNLAKIIATMGLSIHLSHVLKMLLVYNSQRHKNSLGAWTEVDFEAYVGYCTIAILIIGLGVVFINLKSNKSSLEKRSSRITSVISVSLLYVLSNILW